ncbi:MAG: T9SS type A sorting domain-containing protein, partial [Bacteroidales bacterium]|nr:T9SS type A sorting domain-containing protein [Bacteroidales bacterium]
LMWTAGNAPVNSAYNIYKDGSFLVSLDLDVFEYVDTDVSFGNTYCYQLSSDCSSNCSETSLSEEICRLYDYNGIYNLENKLSIAPNPANDYVKINVNGAIKSISIVSTLGQRMLDTNVADNEIRLDVSDFPDGMYIALFETDGLLISRKFIVRH